jgi:hypothetical protein
MLVAIGHAFDDVVHDGLRAHRGGGAYSSLA